MPADSLRWSCPVDFVTALLLNRKCVQHMEVHRGKVLSKCGRSAAKSRSQGLAKERRKETGPPCQNCPSSPPSCKLESFSGGGLSCSLSPSALGDGGGDFSILLTGSQFAFVFNAPYVSESSFNLLAPNSGRSWKDFPAGMLTGSMRTWGFGLFCFFEILVLTM